MVVGIEATGSMGWFLRLMAELEITCHVGHPATIRRAETRRQKHDRRDAALSSSCSRRIDFHRSGCREPSSVISVRCSCTVTSGSASGHA